MIIPVLNSSSACSASITYSMTSNPASFISFKNGVTWSANPANAGTFPANYKMTIPMTFTVSSARMTTVTKIFSYELFDCTSSTETSKTIHWISDAVSSVRTITLPNTSGM